MKTTTIQYECDVCHRKSTNLLDVERVKIPILGMVDCEGKPLKEPYIFMQAMDLCRECAKKAATIAETALNKFEFWKNLEIKELNKNGPNS